MYIMAIEKEDGHSFTIKKILNGKMSYEKETDEGEILNIFFWLNEYSFK